MSPRKHSMRGSAVARHRRAGGRHLGRLFDVVANVPLAFGVLRYSRAFEREADEFAIALLGANGISTHPLLDFFTALETREGKRGEGNAPAFLSSHPPSAERKARLREAGGPLGASGPVSGIDPVDRRVSASNTSWPAPNFGLNCSESRVHFFCTSSGISITGPIAVEAT